MSRTHFALVTVAIAMGCTPVDYHECGKAEQVSLTLRGEDWTGIGDDILHMRVFEERDGWVEQSEQATLKSSGVLEHVFECGLDDGINYSVAMYINTNDELGCQRADKVWEENLGTVTDDLVLELFPDDPQTKSACEHF